MDLWNPRRDDRFDRMMHDMWRDFDRFERRMFPYWRDADRSVVHVGNEIHPAVNDENKFAVTLDVSQFHPEELSVHIEGNELTIEGKQEQKTENSSTSRSFVRKWTLPPDVIMDAVHSQINDKGQLSVEAPKTTANRPEKRSIPILPSPTGH